MFLTVRSPRSSNVTSRRSPTWSRTAEVQKQFPKARIYQDWRQLLDKEKYFDFSSVMHTFVSLLSAHGVPVEAIALRGHNQTATTELVYQHQIVPALTRGAEVMDEIFG